MKNKIISIDWDKAWHEYLSSGPIEREAALQGEVERQVDINVRKILSEIDGLSKLINVIMPKGGKKR